MGVAYGGLNHENFICENLFLSRIWQPQNILGSTVFVTFVDHMPRFEAQ
jgi:hypothetical protein